MIDPVPWFIQAPAEHSAEVARTLAYQAIGGKEGLARSGDLEVVPATPTGAAVVVLPGAAGILVRDPGGAGQAYVGRVASATTVPIAATGSSSGRSDLIVFRVNDPQFGGAAPADPVVGPYIDVEVVSGVNPTVTRVQDVPGHEYDSAITLARIDLPASAGQVLEGMITPLARVANPLTQTVLRAVDLTAIQRLSNVNAYPNGGQTFPSEFTGDVGRIHIPEWATKMRIVMMWGSVRIVSAVTGTFWVQVGQNVHPDVVRTPAGSFDADASTRDTWVRGATIDVPESMRGTDEWFFPRAALTSGSLPTNQQPYANTTTSVTLQVEFFEG